MKIKILFSQQFNLEKISNTFMKYYLFPSQRLMYLTKLLTIFAKNNAITWR